MARDNRCFRGASFHGSETFATHSTRILLICAGLAILLSRVDFGLAAVAAASIRRVWILCALAKQLTLADTVIAQCGSGTLDAACRLGRASSQTSIVHLVLLLDFRRGELGRFQRLLALGADHLERCCARL